MFHEYIDFFLIKRIISYIYTYLNSKNDFIHFFANGCPNHMKDYWKALETTTIYVENIDEIVQPLFDSLYKKKVHTYFKENFTKM